MFSIKNIFNKKSIKVMGVMLGMMALVPSYASISVSPTRIEIDANKIRSNYFTTAVTIKGDNSKVLRFKAYPGYFDVDKNGDLVMAASATKDNIHDISKKLRFVPSEFTVAPGKTQKLRINVAGVKSLPDGENRAILYIEDVNPKEMNLETGRVGMGAQIIVKTRIGIPIYIDSGKYTKIAEVEYLNAKQAKDGIQAEMKILSKGNSKVRYNVKAQIIKGKKLITEENLVGKVIAHGSSQIAKYTVNTQDVKESGEYTLRMIVCYFDEKGKLKNIKTETNINIVGKM